MTTDNLGDAPVPVESLTRRVSKSTPADPIGQLRAAMAHHDRQVREANRPTGTELRHTAQLVDSQHDDIMQAQDLAEQAADKATAAAAAAGEAKSAAGEAKAVAQTASDDAGRAAAKADLAAAGVRRLDASLTVVSKIHETPGIGPDPVSLVEETVPLAAGYGLARVSVAAFGSVPSRGPVALQVRLRMGSRVSEWMVASYAGDGVTYPGHTAPVRSFSLCAFDDDVEQGGVLALEAMCPVKGIYPKSLAGMAHLSARIDYMEVV